MLGNRSETAACGIYYAKGGADLLAVKVAVDWAEHMDTVVPPDDTDILVLLIHDVRRAKYNVGFKSKESKKP